AVERVIKALLAGFASAECDERPIAERDSVQTPRDSDEAAHATEAQCSLEVRHRADVAQHAIDLAEAGRRPSDPSPQQLVQLHRAAALRDQREPAELDLISGRKLDRASSLAVDPEPVGAAEVRQRPDFALARRHGVPPRDPTAGIVEAEGA